MMTRIYKVQTTLDQVPLGDPFWLAGRRHRKSVDEDGKTVAIRDGDCGHVALARCAEVEHEVLA